MKTTLNLIALLACSAAIAQPGRPLLPPDRFEIPCGTSRVVPCPDALPKMQRSADNASKTAASRYRLMSYSRVDVASNKSLDTASFSYSGNRGSYFFDEYNNIDAGGWWQHSSPDYYFLDKNGGALRFSEVVRKYDAADRVTEEILRVAGTTQKVTYTYRADGQTNSSIVSDSTSHGWNAGTRNDLRYDASGRLIQSTYVDLSTNAFVGQTDIHFNAVGFGDSVLQKSWNGTGWTINALITTVCNAAGMRLQEITHIPGSNGLLAPIGHIDYSYDGASRLTTQTSSFLNNGNWERSGRDTFGYTGAKPRFTFVSTDRYDAGRRAWVAIREWNYILNAQSRWSNSSYKSFDNSGALTAWYKSEINYTAGGLVSDTRNYTYDMVTQRFPATPDELERFHYESFEPTSVSTAKKLATLRTVPNPVSGVLRVETPGETIARLDVYSLSGQQLMSVKSDAQQLDVSRLPAGSYILQVQLKDRPNAQMLRFVKL